MNFNFEEKAQTIQSQYSDSPRIKMLIENFHDAINPQKDIELFYNKIFNINTACGIGLDIWGRILGIGRYLILDDKEIEEANFFGFLGSNLHPFNTYSFKFATLTKAFRIEDDAFRVYLLLVRAYGNIASADFESMNQILSVLYPDKVQYVLQAGPMRIRFVFEYALSEVERGILRQGLLTRGAGVGYEYLEVDRENTFGFAHSNFQTFDNGVFVESIEIISE